MNNHVFEKFCQAPLVGRIFIELETHLEAFSGNGLYCDRGMPTMNKYRTVKEVCALTGLTRKHLYYFHHEKVVRAVGYANYSVEGNDGYKLYDEAAVEKLQQISLYYQLGLKRNEIRDIMRAPDYDRNLALEKLLITTREKRERLDLHIAALEYLCMTGMKNGLVSILQGISLEELGTALATMKEYPPDGYNVTEEFTAKLEHLLTELSRLQNDELAGQAGEVVFDRLVKLVREYMGSSGTGFLLGLFVSAIGEGAIAKEISPQITAAQGKAGLRYLVSHAALCTKNPQEYLTEGKNEEERK